MKNAHGLLIIGAWVALSAPLTALAQHRDYLPLSRAETRNRFAVRYVGKLDVAHLIPALSIGANGADVALVNDEDIVITGTDKAARAWSVQMAGKGPGFAYELYTADLDNNGYRDAILVSPTGGNGLAPSAHLITLMFDSIGRPILFEADGYFEYDEKGIPDLIDSDRNGKAELLYMNYDDGYWITNLYTAGQGRWQRVDGQFGQRRYPLYTRFTHRPNHRPVVPRAGRHPFAPDLSNRSPKRRGRLLSFKGPDGSASEDMVLKIKTAPGAVVTCAPESWYGSFAVLLDEPEGRRIVSLSGGEQAMQKLLNEIAGKGYTVALYGERRAGDCSPELLWAQPGPGH